MSPPASGPALLPADIEALRAAVRHLHEDIRAAVGERLRRARTEGRPELASRPLGWGAGDLTFALDAVAEEPLDRFGRALGARGPLALVAEGPGLCRFGGGQGPALRAIIDPVDGTRPLMHDLRPAWAVTGIAPDRGERTRLSDVVLAVQTELPTTTARSYHVLSAVRGRGATLALHDVESGECLGEQPLRVADELPVANGFYSFTRYLRDERPLLARLEHDVLGRLQAERGVDPHLLYEDQYLASAGQLFLVATGRYRLLADLRAWLRETLGLPCFTVKPYDVGALLVFTEAGVPVLDAAGRPLDASLDTTTPLSIVAYGNAALRSSLEPLLSAAMNALLAAERG